MEQPQPLLEKKKYSFEKLLNTVSEKGSLDLQDLIETEVDEHLYTLFVNHTLVIRDVENLSLITYEDKPFIHGIVDVYDRVLREKLYNSSQPDNGPKTMENDQLVDIVIRSNLVINVMELNVLNFIQQAPGDSIGLPNKYLIELYTDWNTQMHYKENVFFNLFFK
ncbi:hypothetical protein J2S74_000138 [Evansella vedderi]|uniref:Uncharacterized protein n=1 Tax=Evansella vedderi TaxID=38282 RepID=A0ABT9ZNG1_9BACI|nr:hypothetical protein [Evansella vedderi]MDQ0252766.1 hypothetical protein [Evansella vedderi]